MSEYQRGVNIKNYLATGPKPHKSITNYKILVYYNKIPTEWLIKVRNSNKFNIYVYHRSQFLD